MSSPDPLNSFPFRDEFHQRPDSSFLTETRTETLTETRTETLTKNLTKTLMENWADDLTESQAPARGKIVLQTSQIYSRCPRLRIFRTSSCYPCGMNQCAGESSRCRISNLILKIIKHLSIRRFESDAASLHELYHRPGSPPHVGGAHEF